LPQPIVPRTLENLIISSNLQESLGQTFDMEKPAVHAIVAKMIISEELMASMDEPSECMIMHRTEPSRLQSLSLQLSDKLAQLVENNERLLELRPGGMTLSLFYYYSSNITCKFNRLYQTQRPVSNVKYQSSLRSKCLSIFIFFTKSVEICLIFAKN
jgi:hypothetical protein